MIGHKKQYRLWLTLLAALLTLTFLPFSVLAQTGGTDESADLCDPVIMFFRKLGTALFLRIDLHRTELDDFKRPSVLRQPGLFIEYRAAVLQFDRKRSDQ